MAASFLFAALPPLVNERQLLNRAAASPVEPSVKSVPSARQRRAAQLSFSSSLAIVGRRAVSRPGGPCTRWATAPALSFRCAVESAAPASFVFEDPTPRLGDARLQLVVVILKAAIARARRAERTAHTSRPTPRNVSRLAAERLWRSLGDAMMALRRLSKANPVPAGLAGPLCGPQCAAIIISSQSFSWAQAVAMLVTGWALGLLTVAILPFLPRIFSFTYAKLGPLFTEAIMLATQKLTTLWQQFWAQHDDENDENDFQRGQRMRFLIAVDGSDTSYCALEHAIQMAVPGRDRIICAWCGSLYDYMYPGRDEVPTDTTRVASDLLGVASWGKINEAKRKQRGVAKTILNKCRTLCRQGGVDCTLEMLTGQPEQLLLDEAAVQEADLLVVGSRGLSIVQRIILGSTSTHLVRQAECPVMVVKPVGCPAIWPRSRNLLVAADGSEHSERAFELALRLARPGIDRMYILCVWRGGQDVKLTHLQDFLLACTTKCKEQGVDSVSEIRSGNVRREILEYTELYSIDYTFVGSRPLSNLQRIAMESVSDFCVHNLECPVVVVK
eukprot:tig00000842_g4824.t1